MPYPFNTQFHVRILLSPHKDEGVKWDNAVIFKLLRMGPNTASAPHENHSFPLKLCSPWFTDTHWRLEEVYTMLALWHPQQTENFYRRVWSHPLNCLSTVVLSTPGVPGQYLSLLSRHHRPCTLVSLPHCLSLLFPSSSSSVSLFLSFCCSCPLSYPLPSSPLIPLSSSFPCVSRKNIFRWCRYVAYYPDRSANL